MGRFDGFYELNLKPWDVCAGDLICREAGGKTSDWNNNKMPFSGSNIIASNKKIHSSMLEILNQKKYQTILD
jgi:myo-inositol-1(or 4)-monophosphatase